jgi:hypothetical protein
MTSSVYDYVQGIDGRNYDGSLSLKDNFALLKESFRVMWKDRGRETLVRLSH